MSIKLFKTSALIVCALFIIGLAGCGDGGANPGGGDGPGSERLQEIAQCLTDKGVNLYGAVWCSHCKDQKELFGDAINYVNYIECDPQTNIETAKQCVEKGIKGIPAWELPNGELLSGVHEPEEIAEKAGC
jgi:hypothetical protein